MNIFGTKVVLRAFEESDNNMLLEMINDPETEVNLGGASLPVSSVHQRKWFENLRSGDIDGNGGSLVGGGGGGIIRCIVAERENLEVGVGTIILSDIDMKNGVAQIHIKIMEKKRGKGVGQDSIYTMVRYAFMNMRLNCIYAEILSYNILSQKVFEKCGFHKDGILRQRVFKEGKYVDVFTYSIISGEAGGYGRDRERILECD